MGMLHEGMKRPGFSLLELMMCVLILGIVCLAAAPMVSSMFDDRKLNGAAMEVAGAVKYAQMLAVSRQQVHGVYCDTAGEIVECYENGGYAGGGPVRNQVLDPLTKRQYLLDFDGGGMFRGIDVVSADFGAGRQWVEFDHTGTPVDMSGSPSDNGTVVLAQGGRAVTVMVKQLTGRVSVY